MAVFTVVSTVTHRSLMNKSKDDLARWVLHLLDCRDENEKLRVQRVVDLLEANNAYQQDARDARIALKGRRFGLTALQQELEALKEQSARQEQTITSLNERAEAAESELAPTESHSSNWPDKAKFQWGDRVTKIKGSSWTGRVCGIYSTPLTPIGYAVESENEPGSVQIYPEAALEGAAR